LKIKDFAQASYDYFVV